MTSERTSIQIFPQTRARLQKTGCMGETYDSLINRLLDEREAFQEAKKVLE